MSATRGNFDIDAARRRLAEKARRRSAANRKRRRQALNDFNRIVDMLVTEYNPPRIWQWGSLLDENSFSEISDIDVAVEGVKSSEEFFAMFGAADDLTDFSLDMVQMEKIHPLHADSIRKKGRLVYERSKT